MSREDDILDNGMKNMPGVAEPDGTIGIISGVRLGTLSTVQYYCTVLPCRVPFGLDHRGVCTIVRSSLRLPRL